MKFLNGLVFLWVLTIGAVANADVCGPKVAPLLDALFSSLGHDCQTYASLFADDAQYFHQHDGYKTQPELLKNCQNYANFCAGDDCRFLQAGQAVLTERAGSCEILVPYLWSEIPANHQAYGNLEPHTGFEYIVATPEASSQLGYRIRSFAELETSYSVAFDWAKPDHTPALVAQSTLPLLALKNSASRGECNRPIAPILTNYFHGKSNAQEVWRQQGDAVVLAIGGFCQITVPYSAQVGKMLKTGHFVFILQPGVGDSYQIEKAVEFARVTL